MRPLEHLQALSGLPHRGSGTPEEAAAADRCAALLRQWGYDVAVDQFTAPRQTLYNGILFLLAAYAAAAVLGMFWSPWAGLLLGLLLLVPIAGELTGGRPDFDVFVPKARSQNVVAEAPDATGARPHVVLTAHIDTQLGSLLFAPGFVRFTPIFFTINYAAIVATLVALGLRAGGVAPAFAHGLQLGALGVMAAGFVFVLIAKLGGAYVNGANDNASGVAIALAIAEAHRQNPLPIDLTVLLTGAEEVGERGMKHFMATTGKTLNRDNTYFINLDNVGGGVLRYQLGEGMVVYYKYSPVLVGLAKHLAARVEEGAGSDVAAEHHLLPLKNTILPTDALIPARQRFHAITFLAQNEDGSIPNYHWHTDTLAGVDAGLVEFTGQFIWSYISALPEWIAAGREAVGDPAAGGPVLELT